MIVVPIYPEYGEISVLSRANGKHVSGLKADLCLTLIALNHTEYLVPFRIDSGASCSSMSMARAERLGLLRPDDLITEIKIRSAVGDPVRQTVRLGKLHVRLPLLRDQAFEWPVLFLESKPLSNPPQLGLAGVLSDLIFHFDGSPSPNSLFGTVTIALRIPVDKT